LARNNYILPEAQTMQSGKSEIQNSWAVAFIIVPTLVWGLGFAHVAWAGWADSAHSNASYGVDRSGATYSIGDCAHCHETFDDATCGVNNLMLFYDDWVGICDLFCFECHSDSVEVQQVDNNPYCVNFGGLSPAYNTNIAMQFCDPSASYWYPDGSRHDLSYIRDFIDNNAQGWGFGSDPNPCVACHNPHYDQRNHPVVVTGTLNTAIRRPSHYKSSDSSDFLWGDDEDERMDAYAATFTDGVYQPPYFGDTTSGKFEPTGTTTNYAGDRTPDYVTFCLDCHQYSVDSKYGPLQAIDWGETCNHSGGSPLSPYSAHGGYDGTLSDVNNIDEPYKQVNSVNYVLSCLDCHEPHGDGKNFVSNVLVRRMINGVEWSGSHCAACHSRMMHH
jgi:hypothetical protein